LKVDRKPWGINELEIRSANFKTVFNVIAENQPVVFVKQLVVYTNSVKNKAKTVLKERKDREINTKSFILVHSLPRAASSTQQPLRTH